MKHLLFYCISILLLTSICNGQSIKDKLQSNFNNTKSNPLKVKYAFQIAEFYLDTDEIDSSQKWLNRVKEIHPLNQIDSVSFFIRSLQSELFYYNNLYQFGTAEAIKATKIAIKLKDSLLISNGYFFQGINFFEKQQFIEAEKMLLYSARFYPKNNNQNHIRSAINKEHIYNNIAQVKIKMNQPDSAIWFNRKAYHFAVLSKSRRGIPNTEQTFGEIYLYQNKLDSASYYFNKSIQSAYKSEYFDVVLINYGLLSKCSTSKKDIIECYQLGKKLLSEKIINKTYQRYFYSYILDSFKKTNDYYFIASIQDSIIAIDDETQNKGNLFLQNFTEQYSKSENKLLSLEIEKLKSEKEFTLLQIFALVLFILLLILAILIIRRKNKLQKQLLEQKNEISKDLHDDIGSGLSSVLIYSNLIINSNDATIQEKQLGEKINQTTSEISKRLHAFIWSLNAEHNNLHFFIDYIKQYIFNQFDKTDIVFHFNTKIENPEEIKLDGRIRKNLFYIIKEICTNILKHSQASKVEFSIEVIDKKILRIQIQDNGKGLSEENPFGNGLKNIQNRIQLLNGKVSMVSHNGLKTILEIKL